MDTSSAIVGCYKNSMKKYGVPKLYFSILTMKNKLRHEEAYYPGINPDDEKTHCSCGNDCYLYNFKKLENNIVMVLDVERGNTKSIFEVRTFDDHTVQNCLVMSSYLSYIYDNRIINKNILAKQIINDSQRFYNKNKSLLESDEVNLLDESEFPVVEVKKILARPITDGVGYSDIVKKGMPEQVEPNFEFDINEFIETIENLRSENDKLNNENVELKSKYNKLIEVQNDKDIKIEQLKKDLNDFKTKWNRLSVLCSKKKD
jgi:hypothetical protein